MGWLKRFPCKFLEELAWNLLMQALLPVVGGGAMIGLFTGFLAWLAKLPWHVIGIIAIFAFLVSMIAIELKRSGLKIRFCDAQGRFISDPPQACFWSVANNLITYYVHGFARLSNLGWRGRSIESAYVSVIAKGKELEREILPEFHIGTRLSPLDTTKECLEFSLQRPIDEYMLRELVGLNYKKAKVELVVEAAGAKAKVRFHNRYGLPSMSQ